jgi:hypothetical protein
VFNAQLASAIQNREESSETKEGGSVCAADQIGTAGADARKEGETQSHQEAKSCPARSCRRGRVAGARVTSKAKERECREVRSEPRRVWCTSTELSRAFTSRKGSRAVEPRSERVQSAPREQCRVPSASDEAEVLKRPEGGCGAFTKTYRRAWVGAGGSSRSDPEVVSRRRIASHPDRDVASFAKAAWRIDAQIPNRSEPGIGSLVWPT